jgi:hypothetical protein
MHTEHVSHSLVNERGSSLLGVVLLLMLMSALAAALGVSGETETLISRNQRNGAQAQAAAEAGLNHAVELAVTYIFEWKANGFADSESAVDALLWGADGDPDTEEGNDGLDARPGIGAGAAIPRGVRLGLADVFGTEYEAWILDDDGIAPAGDPDKAEDGDLTDDDNNTLIVRAIGYGPDHTKVTLEAIISSFPMPAVATNSDLTVSGSYQVLGSSGSIHTNSNLTGDGSAGTVDGVATASGDYNYPDDDIAGYGGASVIPIPTIAASDYEVFADYLLTSTGTMIEVASGSVVCTWAAKTSCNNWDFDSATGGWNRTSNSITGPGTYYVQGPVSVSGSPGSAKDPFVLSIIAEGSISLSGSPSLQPDTPELLFVTDGDLKIIGDTDVELDGLTPLQVQGKMLAHEQIELGGTANVYGQIIAEDAANNSNVVTGNTIHGNPTITYNGGLGGEFFSVSGWRDIR